MESHVVENDVEETINSSNNSSNHDIQELKCWTSETEGPEMNMVENGGLGTSNSVLQNSPECLKDLSPLGSNQNMALSGIGSLPSVNSLTDCRPNQTSPTSNLPESRLHQTSRILDLPECVLLRIFHFVDIRTLILVIRKTCRFWHYLSYDRSLWKILKLDNGGFGEKMGDASFLKMLVPISDLVEEIVFGFTLLLTDESFMHKDLFLTNIKSLDFSLTNVTTSAIIYLTEKYPKITSLNLNHCSYINIYRCLDYISLFKDLRCLSFEDFGCPVGEYKLSEKILKTFKSCHNLTYCEIYATELSDQTLAGIFKCSPQIKELDLTGADELSHLGFATLKKDVHCLTHLSIAYTMIDDKGLKIVAENSPKLKSLNITSCVNISDIGIQSVATHCKDLECFLVHKTNPKENGCSMTSYGLETIALGCHKLKTLCISYCPFIDDKCIIAFASNCPGLAELRLSGCFGITDVSLMALGEHSVYLRDLEVSECSQLTSEGVSYLLARCRWLQCLSLERCHKVSDISIADHLDSETLNGACEGPTMKSTNISSELPTIKSCGDDEHGIGEQGFIQNDRESTNDELSTIKHTDADKQSKESKKLIQNDDDLTSAVSFEACHSLETTEGVSLGHCNSLDVTKNRLERLQNHSHLQSLHLSFCSKITNDTVIEISKHCPDLQQVSLRGCHLVTDIAIASLVRSCEFLRILDLSGGSSLYAMKISNVSLSAIANECKYLERLMVSENKLINLSGLEVLFNRCKSLESLELTVGEPMYSSFTGVLSLVNNINDRIVKIANHAQLLANNKQSGTLHIEFYPSAEGKFHTKTDDDIDVSLACSSMTE